MVEIISEDDLEEDLKSEKIRYVGLRSRLNASIIDQMLIALPFIPFFNNALKSQANLSNEVHGLLKSLQENNITINEFITSLASQYTLEHGGTGAIFSNFLLVSLLTAMVVIIFWVCRSATPGKMLLSMKIVDIETNDRPSTKQLIIRYIGYFISFIPFCLGFFWIAFDKRKQGWHDKLSGTAVIYTKQEDPNAEEKRFRRQIMMAIVFLIIFLAFFFK